MPGAKGLQGLPDRRARHGFMFFCKGTYIGCVVSDSIMQDRISILLFGVVI